LQTVCAGCRGANPITSISFPSPLFCGRLRRDRLWLDRYLTYSAARWGGQCQVAVNPVSLEIAQGAKLDFHLSGVSRTVMVNPIQTSGHGAPETPDQLLAHQCLVQGTETWHFIDGDKTIAVHPQGRFKADNGAALAAAAVAGLGIAALPDFLTEKELASGALVALMNSYPLPEAGIFILRPPGHHPARKVRVLTELLIEHFG
jgi:DNA-binding transcriptional LysR family regulator